jgi:hypothetical protein
MFGRESPITLSSRMEVHRLKIHMTLIGAPKNIEYSRRQDEVSRG